MIHDRFSHNSKDFYSFHSRFPDSLKPHIAVFSIPAMAVRSISAYISRTGSGERIVICPANWKTQARKVPLTATVAVASNV